MSFPLTLKNVVFTKSVVETIQGYKPTDLVAVSPKNEIVINKYPDDPNSYQVLMKCLFNPERSNAAPYFVDMECFATFVVSPDTPEDVRIRGLHITGHSVLFGAIREAVLWITGRFPNGALGFGLSILQSPKKPVEEHQDGDVKVVD